MWWTGHLTGIFTPPETRRVTNETEMVDLVLGKEIATADGDRLAELEENGR